MFTAMHSSGGNANGAPCKFPFLYNSKWYHSCLPSDTEHPLEWCSTTENYDEDQTWGNCLKYGELDNIVFIIMDLLWDRFQL